MLTQCPIHTVFISRKQKTHNAEAGNSELLPIKQFYDNQGSQEPSSVELSAWLIWNSCTSPPHPGSCLSTSNGPVSIPARREAGLGPGSKEQHLSSSSGGMLCVGRTTETQPQGPAHPEDPSGTNDPKAKSRSKRPFPFHPPLCNPSRAAGKAAIPLGRAAGGHGG